MLNSPSARSYARCATTNSARSLGYSTSRYKLLAFTLSASLAGLAGGLKVLVFGVASLTDVHWHANGEVVLMALLGGIGTVSVRWPAPSPSCPCRTTWRRWGPGC